MVLSGSRLKASGQISYHLETDMFSKADVLIFVKVRSTALFHFWPHSLLSASDAVQIEASHLVQVSSFVFILTRHFVPLLPSEDIACNY